MKKIVSLLLAVLMLVPFSTMAFAENTTTLTTVVPGATYTLNIPADQTIDYGATEAHIGNITVTDSSGFAIGKNLYVTVTYDDFTCPNTSTTIPFVVSQHRASPNVSTIYEEIISGSTIEFLGKEDGTVIEKTYEGYSEGTFINISSEDWGKAEPGTYTATITFTAEVSNA